MTDTADTPTVDRAAVLAQIEGVLDDYPRPKSAVIPALRIAQGHYGWLPPEAFEVVAEGLGVTPAFCQSIASFYDMFHLSPTGKHLVEVCTNVSCALKGSGELLDEFEDQLKVSVGGTTDDGEITLREVECLGSCASAPCVSVNHRYREHFASAQVRPLITELRASTAGWAEEEQKS